jgi:hypothetical protein
LKLFNRERYLWWIFRKYLSDSSNCWNCFAWKLFHMFFKEEFFRTTEKNQFLILGGNDNFIFWMKKWILNHRHNFRKLFFWNRYVGWKSQFWYWWNHYSLKNWRYLLFHSRRNVQIITSMIHSKDFWYTCLNLFSLNSSMGSVLLTIISFYLNILNDFCKHSHIDSCYIQFPKSKATQYTL